MGAQELSRKRRLLVLAICCMSSAPFSGATVIAVCTFAALGGFLFLNTLYLQDVRGYSALHAGLCLLPIAAMIVVCAPLSGRIVASRGPRLPLAVTGIALLASGIMLTRLTTTTPASWLITSYLDRKSTRLNSSHLGISYAVFCLKKKKPTQTSHGSAFSLSSRAA